MKITVLGSYPRIPAGAGPSVRTALNRFDAGQITPWELETTVRAVTRSVLELAAEMGLDTTTDGQIRWHDLLDPIVRDVDNLRPGGLQRYFNNNFYYRRPEIVGRLAWAGGALAEWTRIARALYPDVALKVALPGPFTVAQLADDLSYRDRARLLADLVDVLRLEAESVARVGVAEIQWDEPALVAGNPPPTGEVEAVLRDLAVGPWACPVSLAFYFGSLTPYLDVLARLPYARVYGDVVADPTLATFWSTETVPYEVGLGLLDAREVRLEAVDAVAETVAAVVARQGRDRVWLHPNAGLEWLPPDWARRKVERLAAVRKAVEEAAHA